MIRRWARNLFGTPRRVAVTAGYLVGLSALGMLLTEVLGEDGFTVEQFVKGLVWSLLMSPLLHPAYDRPGGALRAKSRSDEPAGLQ